MKLRLCLLSFFSFPLFVEPATVINVRLGHKLIFFIPVVTVDDWCMRQSLYEERFFFDYCCDPVSTGSDAFLFTE